MTHIPLADEKANYQKRRRHQAYIRANESRFGAEFGSSLIAMRLFNARKCAWCGKKLLRGTPVLKDSWGRVCCHPCSVKILDGFRYYIAYEKGQLRYLMKTASAIRKGFLNDLKAQTDEQ